MTTQFPVHADDVEQLLKIRRYLIGFRITNGWNQPTLSQMINGTKGMVWDLEANKTWQWRLSRLQAWPVPFGMRLQAKLVFDDTEVDEVIHGHPEVAAAFCLSRGDAQWPKWQRIYLALALTKARKCLDVSTTQLAEILGVTYKAVLHWEVESDELMLPKVLHHARCLGGYVKLGLEEDEG